jgi:peptidoglycan hydrolase-like protein with peptidoglycan-binding domain
VEWKNKRKVAIQGLSALLGAAAILSLWALLSQNTYTKSDSAAGKATSTSVSSAISSSTISQIQVYLTVLGYKPGPDDGIMGTRTRSAIEQFQRDKKLSVTGQPSSYLLAVLRNKAVPVKQTAQSLGFKLCNKTDLVLYTAIAYDIPGKKTWHSEGWWRLNPGQCKTPLQGKLTSKHYYTHAGSEPTTGESLHWTDEYNFCTVSKKFSITATKEAITSPKRCKKMGYKSSGFNLVDVGSRSSYAETFVYPKRGYRSLDEARDAGHKRMLRLIQRKLAALGYNPGSADGAMGPRTGSAIRKFRQGRGPFVASFKSYSQLLASLDVAYDQKTAGRKRSSPPIQTSSASNAPVKRATRRGVSDWALPRL